VSTHNRPERVGHEIQALLGELFARGMRDPRIGFITITGVKMSPDLRVAKVFYSMIGTEEQRAETKAGLDAAKGFVRREVTSRVKLRISPEIYFSFDGSLEEGDKIERLLKEVKAKEGR
jgi:ribosome-binding factor A